MISISSTTHNESPHTKDIDWIAEYTDGYREVAGLSHRIEDASIDDLRDEPSATNLRASHLLP